MSSTAAKDVAVIDLKFIYTNSSKSGVEFYDFEDTIFMFNFQIS